MLTPMIPNMPPGFTGARLDPSMMQQMYSNVARMQQAMMTRFGVAPPLPAIFPPATTPRPQLSSAVLDVHAATPPAFFRSRFPNSYLAINLGLINEHIFSLPSAGKQSVSSSSDSSDTSSSSAESSDGEPTADDSSASSDNAVAETSAAVAANEEQVPVDWESGGKVEKKSAARKRRERQQRLRNMHKTMQSGQFWKIREMQREKYGF